MNVREICKCCSFFVSFRHWKKMWPHIFLLFLVLLFWCSTLRKREQTMNPWSQEKQFFFRIGFVHNGVHISRVAVAVAITDTSKDTKQMSWKTYWSFASHSLYIFSFYRYQLPSLFTPQNWISACRKVSISLSCCNRAYVGCSIFCIYIYLWDAVTELWRMHWNLSLTFPVNKTKFKYILLLYTYV